MSGLSEKQILFLRLHKYHTITEWREVLGGGSIRVTCSRGIRITLGHHEVMPLAEAGLISKGSGGVHVEITEKGKERV